MDMTTGKVALCADLLMTKVSEQDNNVRWMKDILSRPLLEATGTKPAVLSSQFDPGFTFSREEFFALSGTAFDPLSMHLHFDAERISSASLDYLSRQLSHVDILVGYEMSWSTKKVLDKIGKGYIDFWLHPVRFLDDVLFGFMSNVNRVHQQIGAYEVDSGLYYHYADRLRIQSYKGFRRTNFVPKQNSALFVGQTLLDKAICRDGQMLTVLDFEDRFRQVAKKFSHVYYSRHPFVRSGDEAAIAFVRGFPNVSVIDEPAYNLLTQDEIRFVFSVSSSVVEEARYFDKEVEYLYQPPVPLGTEPGKFVSVYHDFLMPHFWSDVLGGVVDTRPVPKRQYLDGKDKIRDMLSFYWGYRNIDKVESLKQTVSKLFDAQADSREKKSLELTAQDYRSPVLQQFRAQIASASVVTFDVFDTLLSRRLVSPIDVFRTMENRVRDMSSGKIVDFCVHRVAAEHSARERVLAAFGHDDPNLDEIYEDLQASLSLDPAVTSAVKELEVATELDAVVPRQLGVSLYELARHAGKDILLVSDMYLSAAVIEQLLAKVGITGYAKLYVSSEARRTKRQGDLFRLIMANHRLQADVVLHVGDNPLGDAAIPQQLGMKVFPLRRAAEGLHKHARIGPAVDFLKKAKTPSDSLLFGTIANAVFDDLKTESASSFSHDDPFTLGYATFGPVVVGFAAWIYQQAKRDNIEELAFLSRDGWIVKQVFDSLFGNTAGAPKTRYFHASRRAARVALMNSRAAILNQLAQPIYSTTLGQYLSSRFGIAPEAVSAEMLCKHGLPSCQVSIGPKFDKSVLKGLLLDLEDVIFARAQSESETLLQALQDAGLTKPNRGIVDIGYAGSMQQAFMQVSGVPVAGYYFATFETIGAVTSRGSTARGYVCEAAIPGSLKHGIGTHRFVYETFFGSAEGSFLHYTRDSNGGLVAVKEHFESDSAHGRFIALMHAGAVRLATDLCDGIKLAGDQFSIPADKACAIFESFVARPTHNDALLVSGIAFEDSLAPSSVRYLVPPLHLLDDQAVAARSVWPAATKALTGFVSRQNKASLHAEPAASGQVASGLASATADRNRSASRLRQLLDLRQVGFQLERRAVERLCSEKKLRKYYKDRTSFFADSKRPALKIYSHLFC